MSNLKEKVEQALVEVKQFLRGDGGDCEVISAEDGVVKVKLTGACQGCPFAALTMKMRVEKIIKERVPEVKEVIPVEEDSSGNK